MVVIKNFVVNESKILLQIEENRRNHEKYQDLKCQTSKGNGTGRKAKTFK